MNRNTALIIGGFVLLGGLAIAGWTHRSSPQPQPINIPSETSAAVPQPPVTTASPASDNAYDQYGAPLNRSVPAPGYHANGYGDSAPYASSASYRDGSGNPFSDRYIRSIHRPVRVIPRDRYYARDYVESNGYESREPVATSSGGAVYREREVTVEPRHHRSMKKSLAIVGGSAAGGALIGGLAGGGKGAAIGAAAGGVGGFVYDRMTHNH